MTMLLAYLAVHGQALAIGALLGAAITICWVCPPPTRHEKTRPATSSRKAGRVRVSGGAR